MASSTDPDDDVTPLVEFPCRWCGRLATRLVTCEPAPRRVLPADKCVFSGEPKFPAWVWCTMEPGGRLVVY
jgi:hypothetical protein